MGQWKVCYFDENHTYIQIEFNPERLIDNHELLMHKREGNPPFHVLGPVGGKPGEKNPFPPR
jgi:hypothetical protein